MNKNNNNYLSKTLLCLAIGGGLTYIRKFKNNNTETNNIDTIFNKKKEKTNNPIIYTKEERNDIFNEFIKSKKKNNIETNNIENNELKITETINNELNKDIYTITNHELNTQNNENTYKFYTNKGCYYKIKINIEINIEDSSSIIINLNNFKYSTETNEKNNHIFIFDNIIFDNTYQTLEVNNKFDIFIKEYPINNVNINNGIIIINFYPYFLNNNLLPDFVEKDDKF
jgi:hypothetical protein